MNKNNRIYNFTSDTVFKYFIKNKEYRNWFYEIIKEKTGIDLTHFHLTDNEANTGNGLKDYRMDVVLENQDTKVIIEANASDEKGVALLKAYMYLYRVESDSLLEGEEYKQKCTKLIMFNNFRNEASPDLAVGNYLLMNPLTGERREDIESYEIYLPIFHQIRYNEIESKINKRLFLLGVKDLKEVKDLNITDENLKIIKEYERLIGEDARFGYIYDAERDQKRTINTIKHISFDEGVEEGEKRKALETAKNLLEMGTLTLEQIATATNVPIEEIKKLQEKKE